MLRELNRDSPFWKLERYWSAVSDDPDPQPLAIGGLDSQSNRRTNSPGYYHALRQPFVPDEVKLLLLFESPPASGRYFYDPEGRMTEPLYGAIMNLFGWTPETKAQGLALMRESGCLLLDATYQHVNGMPKRQRRDIMRTEYPLLRERLPDAPILIGMVGVLDAVKELLLKDGYEVLNGDLRIPFPANGQQRKFYEMAREALRFEVAKF